MPNSSGGFSSIARSAAKTTSRYAVRATRTAAAAAAAVALSSIVRLTFGALGERLPRSTPERPTARPGADGVGSIYAISVETGKTLWTFDQRAGVLSLMSTAGGLVFGGDVNGRFRALDQDSGAVLWEVNLGAPVSGYPISFAVDGVQYVAVSTGPALAVGGMNALTPELRPGTGSNLFVFALPASRR